MIGPGSATWRNAVDWRLLLGSGRALLLQVAHPTVGAGVADHSDFRKRPWQRLRRTIDSLMLQEYGGERAYTEARRLRELHKGFKGVDQHGQRYSALDPDAYCWVHATLFEAGVDLHANFGPPLPLAEQHRLYAEWRWLGEVLGIKASRMPATLTGFWEYFRHMVADELADNKSVRDVLASLADRKPVKPPWPHLPDPVWRLAGPVASGVLMTATVGTLPPPFRSRLGLQWTKADELRLRALKRAVRVGMPLVPPRLRYHPMALAARRCR
ncbi:oxygenase MpaB family protein [Actinocrispum wychmicini]|uniref:Uncharacterized protein (DUF2236 family) n=1 Tax=Actinocrispum wychmicini TaxID=1213861 RepID=A0A4R2JYX5_9PSEU|nr:oxygenase MpaB family protein [Actinocrispum wychmicini]TCO65811.1 uncharacterized protein (DUF2236 family) [Actinocrispum wychmicini]